MKIYGQLFRAQLDNVTADYSSGIRGMIWLRTDTSPVVAKFSDGAAVRTIVTTDNVQTLTNKVLSDSTTSIVDDGDATKVLKFQCSGITTGTTRTYTAADQDGTIIVSATPPTTKGDLLARTATGMVRLGVGTDGYVLTADAAETTGVKWATAAVAPISSYEISNLGITASVDTGALTVNIKQFDGSDPSAGSPVKIGFRNATAGTGQFAQRTLTSAASGATITVPSTATLGFASAATQYLYVYAIDNSGTIEIGVCGVLLDEGTLQTSTSVGTGSDSINVLYSTTGRASKAIRLIARLKFSLTTAGTWDEVPDEISLAPFREQAVAAKYSTATAQSFATGSEEVVDYGTKEIDTHNAVTTGASWKFTAPEAGVYLVSAKILLDTSGDWSAGETLLLKLHKNGSPDVVLDFLASYGGSAYYGLSGSTIISLAAGDYVDVRLTENSGTDEVLINDADHNHISIIKIGDF